MSGPGALGPEEVWRHLLDLGPAGFGRQGPLEIDDAGGWTCDVAVDEEARVVLDVFAPLRVRSSLVVAQLGQSVDGRIATASGDSHYINGPEDLVRLHRLRALVQAVVVGAGTVAADNPRLTVRHVQGSSPVRVVLDPKGTLDPDRIVFTDDGPSTLWVTSEDAPPVGGGPHVEQVRLPLREGRVEPADLLDALASRGLTRVLVEGGGRTVSSFLEAGCLDRLHLSVAPLLLGSGRPSISLPDVGRLDRARRPPVRHFRFGQDLLFDLELDHP